MDIASLGIRIDSSQAKEATSSLDKLAAIGGKVQASIAATAEESQKLSKHMKTGEKAVASNSRSIDQYIKSLQVASATTGMSARETALYSLSLKGANSAQLQAADSALRLNEAYEKGQEIGNNVRKSLLAIGAVAATGLIAAAVAFESLVHKAGAFQDLAEKTGDSAENIASLAVSAGVAGISVDRVADFSVKLSKNLTGVDDESKAAGAAITALGLDLETFKNLKPADQVEQLGKALNSFNDSGAKASALDALARGSADLLPFLKELGQEGGRQVILTEQQIRLADDYSDRQAKLRAQLTLQAEAIATQMLPAYNAFSEVLVDIAKDILDLDGASKKLGHGGEIQAFAQESALMLANLADVAYDVGGAFRFIGDNIGSGAAIVAANLRLDFAGAMAIRKASDERNESILKGLGLADKLEAKFAATGRAAAAANANPADYSNEGRSSGGGKTLVFDGRVKAPKKDSTAGQIAKAQLALDIEDIKKAGEELISIYSNAERVVEAQRSAGLVNEKEYYAAKLGLLNLNTQAQEDALKSELARLNAENLTGRAKLDNDRKILDVEAKLTKLRQSSSTSVEVLAIQQNAALESTTRAYQEARMAAQDYLDTAERGYKRTLDAFGRGDSARNQASGRNQIEDKYATQRQDISNKAALDKDQSPDNQAKYKRQLDLIDEYRQKSLEGWDSYYQNLKDAEGNWANGATRAVENYLDNASNMAKQTEDLLTNAFKGAEDALVSFVTTGKADFSSLAQSILADLARIQIKQAEAALLENGKSWVKSGASGIADWFKSFDGGGYTGGGSRSGGVDGKGGFISIMHPQETVIDHTKGQTMGGGDVSVNVNVDASGTSSQGDGQNAQQLGSVIGNAVRAVILQEKRNGGLLA